MKKFRAKQDFTREFNLIKLTDYPEVAEFLKRGRNTPVSISIKD